jgi:hypothetical protein
MFVRRARQCRHKQRQLPDCMQRFRWPANCSSSGSNACARTWPTFLRCGTLTQAGKRVLMHAMTISKAFVYMLKMQHFDEDGVSDNSTASVHWTLEGCFSDLEESAHRPFRLNISFGGENETLEDKLFGCMREQTWHFEGKDGWYADITRFEVAE